MALVGTGIFFLAAILLAGPSTAADAKKSPPLLLLIRHAEKPTDEMKAVDLSPAGKKRAAALPNLFVKSADRPVPFPTPDFIFAAANSPHSSRSTQTVEPLAKKLGLKVHDKYANDDFDKLATHLLADPKYAGKTVLVCWHHGKLDNLAKSLGAKKAPHIEPNVFNRIWRISYTPEGKATFADLPQRVLPDDPKK
jgi:phosphohistidine phosphatase SixA